MHVGTVYTVKKFTGFVLTKPSDLTKYSRPGRVWLVTSRLGTENIAIFFIYSKYKNESIERRPADQSSASIEPTLALVLTASWHYSILVN